MNTHLTTLLPVGGRRAPVPTPGWNAVLDEGQHLAIAIALVISLLSLLAALIFFATRNRQVRPPYRQAYLAGVAVLTIASLSYALLTVKFFDGYMHTLTGLWEPTQSALFRLPLRYIDWSMTVPLLIVELIGVSTLAGARGYRLRTVGVIAGFAMIFTGWIGAQLIDNGYNLGARITWGLISTAFFIIVYGIVAYVLMRGVPETGTHASRPFRAATFVLLATWFVYPVLYGVTGVAGGPEVIVGTQIAYCVADIVAKVGFGLLVLTVAVRRSRDPEPHAAALRRDTLQR